MEIGLVGSSEISKMLGVSRQRVHAILKSHEDFPSPIAELSAGKIWNREEVAGWIRSRSESMMQAKRSEGN